MFLKFWHWFIRKPAPVRVPVSRQVRRAQARALAMKMVNGGR